MAEAGILAGVNNPLTGSGFRSKFVLEGAEENSYLSDSPQTTSTARGNGFIAGWRGARRRNADVHMLIVARIARTACGYFALRVGRLRFNPLIFLFKRLAFSDKNRHFLTFFDARLNIFGHFWTFPDSFRQDVRKGPESGVQAQDRRKSTRQRSLLEGRRPRPCPAGTLMGAGHDERMFGFAEDAEASRSPAIRVMRGCGSAGRL